jgi:hypothetical protein
MTDVIAWFRAFLDTEWAAWTAYRLEDDLGTFLAAKSAYEALKHKKAGGLGRISLATPADCIRL